MADNLCEDEWWKEKDQDPIKDKKISKKRKMESSQAADSSLQESTIKAKKKKKRNKKEVLSKSIVIDENTLWTFFAKETKGKLSQIELEDLQPHGSQFLSADCQQESINDLSKYLKKLIPDWESEMKIIKDKDKGCPLMLVITSSAKRSVEILRAMQDFKTMKCKTAKLFAKHFKLEDQEAFLEKSLVHVGVGTPNRILKLKSDGYLKFKRLKYVIIDWSYEDAKKRKLVDIPEVKADFLQLMQTDILVRLKQKKLKYCLF